MNPSSPAAGMPIVVVKPVLHYDEKVAGIFFPKDWRLVQAVKRIKQIRFSKTLRGWYIPISGTAASAVRKAFEHIAVVDARALEAEDVVPRPALPTCPKEYVDHLLRKRYSEATVRNYCAQFSSFLHFCGKHHDELSEEDINRYMKHLVVTRKVSSSTQNVAINAIKFYLEKVKRQPQKVYSMERPIRETRLPLVLSEEEVLSILTTCQNLKHKMMLYMLYATGLRRGELLSLTIDAIDKDRRQIIVRSGKGKKDRITLLSERIVEMLEKYYDEYKPLRWVFEGGPGKPYRASSLHKVFRQALARSGVKKPATLHTLRHSFATHLLESGTDIRYIQALLGHNSSRTTEIYAHVTKKGFDKIRSPLDNLKLD